MQLPRSLSEANELITQGRSSGNGYALNCRVYQCGHAELTACKMNADDSMRRGGGGKRKNTSKDDMDSLTLKKSASRSRITVRRKALAMNADRMLTLTFKENVTDISEAWKIFKAFVKRMHKKYKGRFAYVAVPEKQKRGAWHFHLTLSGYYDVYPVRAMWRKAAGELGGNVDITSPKKHGFNSWNPKRIARYLSKYMTKLDSVEFNKRRYSSGGEIEVPEPMKGWVALGLCMPQLVNDLFYKFTRKSYSEFGEFDAYFSGFYAST